MSETATPSKSTSSTSASSSSTTATGTPAAPSDLQVTLSWLVSACTHHVPFAKPIATDGTDALFHPRARIATLWTRGLQRLVVALGSLPCLHTVGIAPGDSVWPLPLWRDGRCDARLLFCVREVGRAFAASCTATAPLLPLTIAGAVDEGSKRAFVVKVHSPTCVCEVCLSRHFHSLQVS